MEDERAAEEYSETLLKAGFLHIRYVTTQLNSSILYRIHLTVTWSWQMPRVPRDFVSKRQKQSDSHTDVARLHLSSNQDLWLDVLHHPLVVSAASLYAYVAAVVCLKEDLAWNKSNLHQMLFKDPLSLLYENR